MGTAAAWARRSTSSSSTTFLSGRLAPYKLYIFLNPVPPRRATDAAPWRGRCGEDGRTALWIYAPGYIRDRPGLENMEDLTGIRFGLGEQPWGPLVHITDFDHPVTRDLPRDLSWGTNNKLAPIFHVDDPDARVLGEVVYSQGNCRPGFAVKEFPDWRSVYSAAPNLPAPVLRGIARSAGVHIYSDAGDVLYANRSLVGVHTLSGGRRVHQAAAAGGHGRGRVHRPGDRPRCGRDRGRPGAPVDGAVLRRRRPGRRRPLKGPSPRARVWRSPGFRVQ